MSGSADLTTLERGRRTRATELVAAVPAWAWLSLLVAASALIRLRLALQGPSPWIFSDELLYSDLAKSFAATGHFAIRESPGTNDFGFVYPLLISPAWALFEDIPSAYSAAKVINAVLMSLTAVPAYLLARRLVGRVAALGAAVLVLALPAMVYTSVIMTENAFLPVFLFWVLALVLALERPTLTRQLVAVGLTFLAYETRTQAAVLVPALVSAVVLAIVLEAFEDERGFGRAVARRAAAFTVTWVVLLAGLVAFLILEVQIRGKTLSNAVLGSYSILSTSTYSAHDIARWVLYHVAELDLAIGVLPFAAFLLLLLVALRPRTVSREARAFAVVALSVSVWLLVEVGAFADTPFGQQIQERNVFYLEPLFLIALVAWAAGRIPRAPLPTAVAALVAAAIAGAVPYDTFISPKAVANAFGLLPLARLEQKALIAPTHLNEAIILAAIAGGLVFLLLPRRLALVAPALVLVYLAWMNSPVQGITSQASSDSRTGGVQAPRDWIDAAVGTKPRVVAIWTGAPGVNFVALWDNEFFNRSVSYVYNFNGPPDGLPQETVTIDPTDAVVRRGGGTVLRSPYVLTDRSLQLAGQVVASDAGTGMTVYRTDGPVRVARQTQGIYPDKWSGPNVQYTRYPCARGSLSVQLAGYRPLQPRPVTVVAKSRGRAIGRIVVPPGARRTFRLPLVPERGFCLVNFTISPTAVPAQVLGNKDERALGVLFRGLVYRPRP